VSSSFSFAWHKFCLFGTKTGKFFRFSIFISSLKFG
jgi:hypothetical protein